jgi:DNA-directed RNA polymerase subunit alpha
LLDFHSPKVTIEPVEGDLDNENHKLFVVEPLDRGFGYTYGNSLRRVLLSSLEGAAISAVRIDGVAHEFSMVPGVKEDVTDIILNLKKAAFVLHGEDNEVDVRLVKDGPGAVTAADIDNPSSLEIITPDAYIASLDGNARLEMLLTVRRGHGYVSADDNKKALPEQQQATLDVIPIDSIFSPVLRVAYKVAQARVGQRTDFDKLTLDVETNGAMTAAECVSAAAELLLEGFSIFTLEKATTRGGNTIEPPEGTPEEGRQWDSVLIEELELGVRAYNCLKREGIETVGQLIRYSESELLNLPNFGKKSVEEVKDRVRERLGLGLRDDRHVAAPGSALDELGLPVDTAGKLRIAQIESVEDLVSRSSEQLLKIPGFGKKNLDEVRERLVERNMRLRGE